MLAEAGHAATHVRDYGMQSAPDELILAKSRAEDRILVSADSDFATLLALEETANPSFILFREPDVVTAEDYAVRLLKSLFALQALLESGCVVVFRRGRVRVRALPLAGP